MQHEHHDHHCHPEKASTDYLLWGSLFAIIAGFAFHYLPLGGPNNALASMAETIVFLMQKMAWGLIFAIGFVGLMDFIPRSKFHQVLGKSGGFSGIWRATLAGVLLDLCSHGILLVAMKLYERGASLGQVVAFLVASPWNSLSMTLILWSLVGFKLTIVFIVASCVIALISGLIFEWLVKNKILSENPNKLTENPSKKEPWFIFPKDKGLGGIVSQAFRSSLHESRMILRWIFFGVLLTAVVKELISPENFQTYFGADTVGVLLTLVTATVLEVCSEGSAPLAAELVTTAKAPGNGFTFLMAGVSTDYTEILALKETTKSWKIAFFLPLVTLPQIIVIGIILNGVGS